MRADNLQQSEVIWDGMGVIVGEGKKVESMLVVDMQSKIRHSSTRAPCCGGGQDRTQVGPWNFQHNSSHNGQDPAPITMKSMDPANDCPSL